MGYQILHELLRLFWCSVFLNTQCPDNLRVHRTTHCRPRRGPFSGELTNSKMPLLFFQVWTSFAYITVSMISFKKFLVQPWPDELHQVRRRCIVIALPIVLYNKRV